MDHAGLYWLFVAMEHLSMIRTPYGRVVCSVCKTCRHRWSAGFPLHLSEMDRCAEEWTEDGNLSLLRWFYEDRGEMLPEWLPTVAARHGRIDVLEWLLTMDVYPDSEACAEASKHGRLGTLAWLRTHDTPWNANTTRNAESSGHVDVLDYAIRNGCAWHGPRYDIERPPLWGVFAYALENGYPVRDRACTWAARFDRFEDLKGFVERGHPLDVDTFAAAARAGTEEMMLWLHAAGCPVDDEVYEQLVRRRDFSLLKRMVEVLGIRGERSNLCVAAEIGDEEAFWWIKERDNPPWGPATAAAIARSGNLRLLKRAIKAGCPTDTYICNDACESGRVEILQWLAKKGYPLQNALFAAARCGDVNIMSWLREQGCKWSPFASEAAPQNGNCAALEWMVEHGCPCFIRTITSVLHIAGLDPFIRLLKRATIQDFKSCYRFRDGEFVPTGRSESGSSDVKKAVENQVFRKPESLGTIRELRALMDLGLEPPDQTVHLLAPLGRWRVVRWLHNHGYHDGRKISAKAPWLHPQNIRWVERYSPGLVSVDGAGKPAERG